MEDSARLDALWLTYPTPARRFQQSAQQQRRGPKAQAPAPLTPQQPADATPKQLVVRRTDKAQTDGTPPQPQEIVLTTNPAVTAAPTSTSATAPPSHEGGKKKKKQKQPPLAPVPVLDKPFLSMLVPTMPQHVPLPAQPGAFAEPQVVAGEAPQSWPSLKKGRKGNRL